MSSTIETRFEFSESRDIFSRLKKDEPDQPILVCTGAFSALALDCGEQLITDPVYAPAMRNLDGVGLTYDGSHSIQGNDASLKMLSQMGNHVTRWGWFKKSVMLSQLIPGEGPGKEALMADFIQNLTALERPLLTGSCNWIRFWTYSGSKDPHNHPFPFAAMIMAGRSTLDANEEEMPRRSTLVVPPKKYHRSPAVGEKELRLCAIVCSPPNLII